VGTSDARPPPNGHFPSTTLALRKAVGCSGKEKASRLPSPGSDFVLADLQFELEIGHGPADHAGDGGADCRAYRREAIEALTSTAPRWSVARRICSSRCYISGKLAAWPVAQHRHHQAIEEAIARSIKSRMAQGEGSKLGRGEGLHQAGRQGGVAEATPCHGPILWARTDGLPTSLAPDARWGRFPRVALTFLFRFFPMAPDTSPPLRRPRS